MPWRVNLTVATCPCFFAVASPYSSLCSCFSLDVLQGVLIALQQPLNQGHGDEKGPRPVLLSCHHLCLAALQGFQSLQESAQGPPLRGHGGEGKLNSMSRCKMFLASSPVLHADACGPVPSAKERYQIWIFAWTWQEEVKPYVYAVLDVLAVVFRSVKAVVLGTSFSDMTCLGHNDHSVFSVVSVEAWPCMQNSQGLSSNRDLSLRSITSS